MDIEFYIDMFVGTKNLMFMELNPLIFFFVLFAIAFMLRKFFLSLRKIIFPHYF